MRGEGRREPDSAQRIGLGGVGPRAPDAVHHQRVDLDARREVILAGGEGARRAGLMDVEDEPDEQGLQGVRAVVEVGDLLGAGDGPRGRGDADGDGVAPVVLPVIRTGTPVRRPRARLVGVGDGARRIEGGGRGLGTENERSEQDRQEQG